MDYILDMRDGYEKIHNVDEPWLTLESECTFLTEKIKDFFAKDGEGSNIRALYEALESKRVSDDDKLIQENFDNASSVYSEYLDGMHKFVEEVHEFKNVDDTVVMEAFTSKISRAIEEDHTFISMLESDNAVNPTREVSYMEAASVLANMVNFIDQMNSQKDSCIAFSESLDANELTKSSTKLICESVSYYWVNSVENMMRSYNELYEAVMHTDDEDQPVANTPFVLV